MQTIKSSFYVDLRALALMRIAIASVILLDLCIRLSSLEAFYSNTGAVPLSLLFQYSWNDYAFSFHTLSGMWQFELLLFLVNIYCALMLLIGNNTRIFNFLCWILMLSLHNRNPLILQGGDDLIRMILFWGLFLPWNRKYALDALKLNPTVESPIYQNLSALAYVLQLVYVYTFSALLKGPEWDSDFTAVYYAFSFEQIAYPTTKLIYYYPELLHRLTALAYYFELLIPLLFFIPIYNSTFRKLAFVLILGFHLFNGCMLQIGLFFVIGIVSAIGILPSSAMDTFDRLTMQFKEKVLSLFIMLKKCTVGLFTIEFKHRIDKRYIKLMRYMLLVFFMVYIMIWNFSNLSFMKFKMRNEMRAIGYLLRLDQNWGMFAPGVIKDGGWYILEGKTTENNKIDLLQNGAPLSYKKPASIVNLYPNDRWRKYGENMIMQRNSYMRGYFCNYKTRVWNEQHPDKRIKELSIIYMYQLTKPNYEVDIAQRQVLCTCKN